MSRCPFGFTADGEDGDDEVEVLGDNEDAAASAGDENGGSKPGASTSAADAKASSKSDTRASSSKKKDTIKVPPPGASPDMMSDPLAFFRAKGITSEADFQAKKDVLREEAKKRLEQLMDKKAQRALWPSDSEFDDMSISSGELSDFDSDVHSLASVRTCAYSWIQKSKYAMPAEATARWAATLGLALSIVVMYFGVQGILTIRPVYGIVRNNSWPSYVFLSALGLAGTAGCLLLAASWRSRKLLLAAHVSILVVYGATILLAVAVSLQPSEVDARMQRAMCGRWTEKSKAARHSSLGDLPPPGAAASSPMCDQLPALQQMVARSTSSFQALTAAQVVACMAMGAAGLWYLFELCYIEKKGAKHVRRHKRSKFTIPWDKIKVVSKAPALGAAGQQGGSSAAAVGAGGTDGESSKDKSA